MALRDAEAAIKEKENSLSSLEEAARIQREEAQKNIAGECSKFRCCWVVVFRNSSLFLLSELRQQVADETAAK